LSRPNLVFATPLCLCNVAWRSSFVANLSNIVLGHALATEVEAHVVASRCRMAMMTLSRNLIWPYNSFVLNHCTNFLSVSPSLASKLMKRKLNLRSSYLGASARVSTA
jgi:hypothetical protein